MKITRIQAHHCDNIPIQPPPFRKQPDREEAFMVEVETDQGIIGWGTGGYAHPIMVDFINYHVAPVIVGEDPLLIERILLKLYKTFSERFLGRVYQSAVSTVDIALWDIKGKFLGQPVYKLLGGARDKVPVYITHGAAYGGAPVYSVEELAAEAQHLVKLGNNHLKNTVGRQAVPDPDDDFVRMKGMRDAIGPKVKLAMDGNCRMTVDQAIRLCHLCEDLNIAFLEEPILQNDPALLAELRRHTIIPIAAAEHHRYTARDLLAAGAIDILQPNVCNDGGYSGGMRIAAMARYYNRPISHGNGNGPHNIALQAGLANGTLVEYHFHKWMLYNAIFKSVPQPENGFLHLSQEPGLGLDPKPEIIKEYEVKHDGSAPKEGATHVWRGQLP